jgi:hypothetical protein
MAHGAVVKFNLDELPRQFYEDLLAELPPRVEAQLGGAE